MVNLKKYYILKIINILIAGIFIIDTAGYGYALPNKSSLRVPSITTTKEGQNRLKGGMALILNQEGLASNDNHSTSKTKLHQDVSKTIETGLAKNNTTETRVLDKESENALEKQTQDILAKSVSDLLRFKSSSLYSDKGDEFKVNLYTKPSKRHPGNMWYRLVMAVPNNGDRVGYFDFRIDETNKKEYFDVSWQFDEMDVFDPMSITKREAKIWTGSNEYAIEVKIPYRKEYEGIGSMLMTLGLKIAKEKGMEKVEINANPTDDGKRLREQMGFDDK